MSTFDNLSPLSTNFPQFSSFRSPNFNNVFKIGEGLSTRNLVQDAINLGNNPQVLQGLQDMTSHIKEVDAAKKSINNGKLDINKAGLIASYAGVGADILSSFLPEKSEYDGTYGDITQTIDQTWDGLSNMAASFGPIGLLVSGGMKTLSFMDKGMNALGGGTDAMTRTDALLSNPLTGWNIGAINGFTGKRANTITKDTDAFETVGASYGGTLYAVDEALEKSGKKYGGFSGSARRRANRQIAEAKRQQSIMSDIADDATDRFNIKYAMSAINGNNYAFKLQGGYDLSAIRVGKKGMSFKDMQRAKRIISSSKFSRNSEILDLPEFKEGGTISSIIKEVVDIPQEFLEFTLKEVSIDNLLPEFKEGGKFNVIPEGALHARKNNMEIEGITKKGIPVVSESDGGEILQHAEIEREEIILRLEVTKKIEELKKKFESASQKEKDEFALEAGKLLTFEILENTIDNTGLLNDGDKE